MRSGPSDDELRRIAANLWTPGADRYAEMRGTTRARSGRTKVDMSFIGG